MATISSIRKSFHVNQARRFLNDIYYGKNNLYYFMGYITPFKNSTYEDVPHEEDRLDYAYHNNISIRDNILYLKRMQNSNTSIVIPRHDWVEGQVWSQWDDRQDLYSRDDLPPFYTYNTVTGEVFKCLFNNFGARSTVMPQGVNYELTRTTDGYIWKYMYTVDENKIAKFVNSRYIPVQKAIDEHFYTGGEISNIDVEYHGSGYRQYTTTTVHISDLVDEKGPIVSLVRQQAFAKLIIGGDGSIISVVLVPQDYYIKLSSSLLISGPYTDLDITEGYEGAMYEAILPNGSYDYYVWCERDGKLGWHKCTNVGGMGYYNDNIDIDNCITISDPNRTNASDSDNASFKVALDGMGHIAKIVPIKGGKGYTNSAIITVFTPQENKHVRILNTVVDSSDSINTGCIKNVILTDTGERYTINVRDTSLETAEGTFRPVATVVENLYDYSGTTPVFVGEGSARYEGNDSAIVVPQLMRNFADVDNKGDFYIIDNISIVDPGKRYNNKHETEIVISGDGYGATAIPIIDINGTIQDVVVTNGGHGYTYAYVDISTTYGTGAEFNVNIGSGELTSEQATVEQLASEYEGSIFAIVTTKIGTGYHDGSTIVKIEGDGDGATAHAEFNEYGNISHIVLDSWGHGYTYVNIIIEDDARSLLGSDREQAQDWEGYAILPPSNGHGYDAVDELGGNTVITYIEIKSDVPELKMVNQDYRYIGMISDLRLLERNKLSKVNSTNTLFTLKVKPCLENERAITDNTVFGIKLIDREVYIILDNIKIRHIIANVFVDGDGNNIVKLVQESSIYKDIDAYIGAGATLLYIDDYGNEYTFEIMECQGHPKVNKYSGEILTLSQFSPIILDRLKTIATRSYITF